MKLGKFVSTMEDLNIVTEDSDDRTPRHRLEDLQNPQSVPDKVDETGVKVAEYEFPEEFVPDNLSMDSLKQTNESLMTNGDLAAQQIDSLKDSIDIVRESDEVTPLTMRAIKLQLSNVMSVFPETKIEESQYLEEVVTTDSPLVVQATVESLMQGQAQLRPIVIKTLQVAKNIAGFLAKSEDVSMFDDRLESAKRALMRTERNEKDSDDAEQTSTDFHQDRYKELYPKIVKAVQAGYESSEVPGAIGIESEEDSIPETAIIAISRGVEKLPLTTNRALSGSDLGSLVEFINKTGEFQDEAIALFGQMVNHSATGPEGSSLTSMNLNTAANTLIAKIYSNRDDQGNTRFKTYPDGPEVIFTVKERSLVPQTDGATNYGWIEPGDLSDMVLAIQEKVSPALLNLKKKAQVFAQIAGAMENKMGQETSDHVQMDQDPGIELTSAFNKLTNVMKFVNDMVTVSVETALNLVAGLNDIARGVSVIIES